MAADSDGEARWRKLAADARAVADQLTDPQSKQIMISIAQAYERLADFAAKRADPKHGK
jgi:hypothetical protein